MAKKSKTSASKRGGSGGRKTGSRPKKSGRAARKYSREERKAPKKNGARKRETIYEDSGMQDTDLSQDIAWIGLLLLVVIMFLSLIGRCGAVGRAISTVMFGLFGIMAYALPFYLFFLTVFSVANSRQRTFPKKMAGLVTLFLDTGAFFGLADSDSALPGYDFVSLFDDAVRSHMGGGLFSGSIAWFLRHWLTVPGAVAVMTAVLLVCFILIFERSFLTWIRRERRSRRERAKAGNPEHGIPAGKPERRVTRPRRTNRTVLFSDEDERGMDDAEYGIEEEIPASGSVKVKERQKPPAKSALSDIPVHKAGDNEKKPLIKPAVNAKKRSGEYIFPPLSLLEKGQKSRGGSDKSLQETAYRLQSTLRDFNVDVAVTDISQGPTVTRYELQPQHGVKVSSIVSLQNDIKLSLAATDIRIEAPIPGKHAVGIEVPNEQISTVMLRDILESREFQTFRGKLPFAVGKDIGNNIIVSDIAKMPHLLIAGATGSGKSVCINTIIMSLIYRTSPEDVRMIMIDPKIVELSMYNGIPHLMIPVVSDVRKASAALGWAVAEMEKRYKIFAAAGVKDIDEYNGKVHSFEKRGQHTDAKKMPRIVVIVDEMADLMMVARKEVEESICRLAQLARAAGIHLIIATQRPTVNVITGLIKANMPSRIAFAVMSQTDSRTILDEAGAEKLLGRGDMLFYPQSYSEAVRIQGAFVSGEEVQKVISFLKENNPDTEAQKEVEDGIAKIQAGGSPDGASAQAPGLERDPYFEQAGRFVIEKNRATIGLLQRVLKIGFNRASRIMEQLSDAGVVSPEAGTKPRDVLMSMEEFEAYLKTMDQ